MDFGAIRLMIRRKLETGRLPLEKSKRVLGRSASGEACGACDMTIGTGQVAMDGLVRKPGSRALPLHLRCFEIWTQERLSLLRDRAQRPGAPAAARLSPPCGARGARRAERDCTRC